MEKGKSTAERVGKLISQAPTKDSDLLEKARAYKHEVTVPIPLSMDTISVSDKLKGYHAVGKVKVIPQKIPCSALEQKHCTHNQNYPLFFIEKSEAFQSRKVKNVKVKERLIATRNLKRLSRQMQQWIYSQVHREIKVLGESGEEFHHFYEKREERHFQIDRIIKYLSD